MLYNVTKCSDLKLRIPKSKHNNLAEVNPDLFASAASRLEELDVSGVRLTVSQLNAMFMQIIQCSDLKLKQITLASFHNLILSSVNPYTLATAICRVETVVLRYSGLTYNQLNKLFIEIKFCKDLKLKTLAMNNANFCKLPTNILTSAVCKLVNIDLCMANIILHQL